MKTRKTLACGILAVVLTLACANVGFAQGKNAIGWDIIPLINGILASDSDNDVVYVAFAFSYERLIVPHFSIGPELDMYFGKVGEELDGDDIPYFYFGLGAAGRYYPMSADLEKFFFGTTLGFNAQSIDGKTKEEDGGFAGIYISLKAGYKLMFGNNFFVEPSMSYYLSKYNFGPTPIGWQGGLRIGVRF